jgi:hypothetical protein
MIKTREQQKEEMLRNVSSSNISVLNDVFFKFVFGSEKRKAVTIEFLSAVLAKSGISAVKDLTFINTERLPGASDGKLARFDVACTLDSGERIDIEVQMVNEANMQQRTLYYWALLYTQSLGSGENYRSLKPAVTVNILNFNLLPHEAPHSVYRIYNQDDREEVFSDDLRLQAALHRDPQVPQTARKTCCQAKQDGAMDVISGRKTERSGKKGSGSGGSGLCQGVCRR